MNVTVSALELLPTVTRLHEQRWGYLVAITGIDEGAAANQITILYHFAHGATLLNLRLTIPRDNPIVPSLCSIIPAASFYERELREMFGVTITNTPNTDYLFLPDNWPTDIYPLRKDFQPEGVGA
ncbi:MAG: NADH-quinone oxidoreductase subunit C [Anaerolineae bacterium]|nr:NADH-quinone oxidoreductase subunit C [Anaerolineae bacterium]